MLGIVGLLMYYSVGDRMGKVQLKVIKINEEENNNWGMDIQSGMGMCLLSQTC